MIAGTVHQTGNNIPGGLSSQGNTPLKITANHVLGPENIIYQLPLIFNALLHVA